MCGRERIGPNFNSRTVEMNSCRSGVAWWIQGVEVCRDGSRVWRYVVVGAGCGGVSWWVQGVEACRGGCRVWRHVVVGAGCGGMSWWVQGVEACRVSSGLTFVDSALCGEKESRWRVGAPFWTQKVCCTL